MTERTAPDPSISRRVAVAGMLSVACLGTACARYGTPATEGSGGGPGAGPAGAGSPSTGSPRTGSAGVGSAGAVDDGAALRKTSEVPVGGGLVIGEREVVLTQPTAGTFKAFSAICTHQGCAVADVANGTINCTCHGSRFNLADGSVASGPARTPLPQRSITIDGDRIILS